MSTIIITGASSGMGKQIAIYMASYFDNIAITGYKHRDELEITAQEILALGKNCYTCVGDISDYDFVTTFISNVHEKYGTIDVLINNAGISYVGLLTDMTYEDWRCVIDTNLTSVFNTCRQTVPYMVSAKSGKIINISSMWGQVGASCEVAYSASKGGVDSFTKALAKELAPSNISVNAISCGIIDTPMNNCFSKEDIDNLTDEIPVGRLGTPLEVSELIYNVINSPSYLTGQIIRIDGGFI